MPRKPKTRAPYRMVSPATWALARHDYLILRMTAEAVAKKHDIGLANLQQTMARKGWTKRALAEAEAALQPEAAGSLPPDPVAEARAAATPNPPSPSEAAPTDVDLPATVLGRARAALTAGRGGEASALLKAMREYVIARQDVADAHAMIEDSVRQWDAAQPTRPGAPAGTLLMQALHQLWGRLSVEEEVHRADPNGAAGLRDWMEAHGPTTPPPTPRPRRR